MQFTQNNIFSYITQNSISRLIPGLINRNNELTFSI